MPLEKIKIKSGDNPRTVYPGYDSNTTQVQPIAPPTPGFIQRVRQMITSNDGSMANELTAAGQGGAWRRAAVDKVVDVATTGKD